MNEQEIRELLKCLTEAGVNYDVCDTPVPVSGLSAVCGIPTELGDGYIDDYILVPKSLLGSNPEMYIPVEGASMIEAGYEQGDRLRVGFGLTASDGDDVVALIDGRCTVKTLYTDEDGTKWFVPRNDEYDAIEVTPDMDVRILAVVLGVEKRAKNAPSRLILQSIRRTKNKRKVVSRLQPEQVEDCIRRIGEHVAYGRQWYAVYRTLQDEKLFAEDSIADFCERVKRLLPEHNHLPEAKEVQRMAVLSFQKPVALWSESNAPVTGRRYEDYLNLARKMSNMLAEK